MKNIKLGLILSVLFVGVSSLAEEKQEPYRNTFKVLVTDDNPFLDMLPEDWRSGDDYGYTYGLQISNEMVIKDGLISPDERWTVSYNTDLYTEKLLGTVTPDPKDNPQHFNEVTTVDVRWDDQFTQIGTGKFYKVIGVGFGLQNDKDSKGYNGIGQQDGWHRWARYSTKVNTRLYENLPEENGEKRYFGSVTAALGKVITFNGDMKDCLCFVDAINLQGGAKILTIGDGSKVFMLAEVAKTVFKTKNSRTSLIARAEANAYTDNNYDTRGRLGIRVDGKKWSLETGYTVIDGPQDEKFFKNVDDENQWDLEVRRKY